MHAWRLEAYIVGVLGYTNTKTKHNLVGGSKNQTITEKNSVYLQLEVWLILNSVQTAANCSRIGTVSVKYSWQGVAMQQ